MELSTKHHERANEAIALRVLADITARHPSSDATRAERYFRDGLALAQELRMRPLVAHCHFGLGKLYERAGERERGREHLTTAATMYREMAMTYWLERLEAERPALG